MENSGLETSLLSKKIFPNLNLSKPAITLNNDVLPQPDGPTRHITLLKGIVRLILSSIFFYLLSEINFVLIYCYLLPLLNNWLLIFDINNIPITHKTTIINEGIEDSIIFSSDAYS